MKTKRYTRLAGLTALILLVMSVSMACGIFFPITSRVETEAPGPVATVVIQSEVPVPSFRMEDETGLTVLYERVNPAVVNITVYASQGGDMLPVSQGSGFVYDQQSHIVTNAHVIHGAEEIEVTFSDATVRLAELVGEDLNSDLAVVKIEDLPEGVQPLPLADMELLEVGQSVVAIGNPFGLEGTLTRGIISALGRSIPALTPFTIPQSIQTDAAINPGNSGGPLLNLQGEVIGVNAQIETDGTSRSNLGVGFAIPVSIVKLVVPDLIEKGEHEWAWLGVRGGNLFPTLVEAMDLPVEKGAYIASVIESGPAGKAGLRGANRDVTVDGRRVSVGGDVITEIDGQAVRSFDDLLIYISLNTAPGQTVTLNILRGGETQEVEVILEERPTDLNSLENP
ncbi:MAG: trypsin-like peptidase domain-containing protein [Anaerolineales bacterium]|nr:MAG: trypsin-like peptidase domain-containing protein [Anaerolineales bacterium]